MNFEHFFEPIRILYFVAGVTVSCVWHWYKCRRNNEKINWRYIGILLGVSAIVFVSLQNVTLANQVKVCQEINAQNDQFSRTQRTAVHDFLRELVQPPADIASRTINDPVRQQWNSDLVMHYFAIIDDAQQKQDRFVIPDQCVGHAK